MNFVYLFFFAAAWLVIQCLIGGTRLLFSLPAYGLLAVGAILSLASLRTRRLPPAPSCVLSTLLLGAWVLFRASRSPVEFLALPDLYMVAGCLMAYLLTAYHLTSVRDRTILVAVLWAIAALEVWSGLIQFLKDPHFMLFGILRRQTIERASGMFISPNHFAGFLEAVAILSLSLAIWSRWPVWARLLGLYMAASCWLGVAISGSRGGYFSTIISLVVFCIGSVYTIRAADPGKFALALVRSVAGVMLMVSVAAFLMAHSQLLTNRMHTMVEKNVRIYNWEAALDNIRLSPWTGTGAGTHLIYGRLFRRAQIQADPVHAHCDYLELLAEYGIVGGLCMLFFLAAHIRNGLAGFSHFLRCRLLPSGINQSSSFAVDFGALCAVAGLAAHSVVDFNMHIPGNALLFAFIFGILANPGIEQAPSFAQVWLVPWGRLLPPALGVWMICTGLPLLPSEWCAEQARKALRDHKYLDAIDFANVGLGRGTAPSADEADLSHQPWTSLGNIGRLVKRFGPNPKNPDLYFYLGEANRGLAGRLSLYVLRRNHSEAAVPAFRGGLQVFPQDENSMVRLAETFDGLHQYQAAEEVYQQCFKLDPNLGILHGIYAAHLQAEGKKSEADAALKLESELDHGEVDAGKKAGNVLQ